MTERKRCVCGGWMIAADWKHQWVCYRCGRTKPLPSEYDPHKLCEADRFWAEARSRVLAIAHACGFNITLREHDDEFLYDLFDDGDYTPTNEEIVEVLEEYCYE